MPHPKKMHNSGAFRVSLILLASMCIILLNTTASLAEPETKLRVGIREVIPFIFIDENQQPSGYSIDLWMAIADQLNLKYSFVPSTGISSTLQDMKDGKLDLAIGAITITEEREKLFDFSYSHFHTGLGIMTRDNLEYSVAGLFSSFFTAGRLINIAGFFLFLLLSAHVIWLAEKKANCSFHCKYLPGIFEGIYWTIVTASTVGYGDYIPKSKLGKFLSVLIIIISLPLFGIFVADFTSDITLHKIRSNINGPKDLDGKLVGVVKGSTSDKYLTQEHLGILEEYVNEEELLSHLLEGGLDAVVLDLPTLQYYANTEGKGKVKIVGKMFNKQDYAFLYPEGSKLNETINRILLKLCENGTVSNIHKKWFGDPKDG